MMKKLIISLLLLMLFLIPKVNVNADDTYVTYEVMQQDYIPMSNFTFDNSYVSTTGYIYTNFNEFYLADKNKEVFDNLYIELMDIYSSVLKEDYPMYRISVLIKSDSSTEFKLSKVALNLYLYSDEATSDFAIRNSYVLGTYYSPALFYSSSNTSSSYEAYHNYFFREDSPGHGLVTAFSDLHQGYSSELAKYNPFNSVPFKNNSNGNFYIPTLSFESSFDKVITGTTDVWKIYNSNGTLIGTYGAGDAYPILYQAGELSSNYITVDLDNYYAVILSLKDYNQTESFSSVLKVKGSIGVTPVYSYGTVEKSSITDRCNTIYDDYTNYRFYVLKDDIINNSVYYIKSCSDGSSFKYDSSIFNIHYITDENKDTPIININGKDYNIIPFENLSNSANKNEEENFIPGESGS